MRLVTSAVMATLALTLSACGGDDPPPPEPTITATTPANPDATLPPMPDVAKEFTPNGAATFVRHYVAVLSFASQTGDVEELRRLSDPDCGGCSDFSQLYEDTYANGGWIRGSAWSMGDSELRFGRDQGSESFVTTGVSVAAGEAKRNRSSDVEKKAASTQTMSFAVAHDDGWRVTQIGLGEVG